MAELGEPVGVEVFTPEEAGAFLSARTGLADPAGAGELAGELGFLPLALAQAAAVIRGQRLSYARYLERLRGLTVAGYLPRGAGQPYPHGVAEAVLLSLQAVRAGDRAEACAAVMEVLSVLSAAGVRRDLLYAAGQDGLLVGGARLGPAAVDEALGQLAEGSLLAFVADGQSVLAHRLVLRVVREQLTQQERLAEVCRAVTAVLGVHAEALSGSLDRPAVRDVPEQVAALQLIVAGLAGEACELETAILRLRSWAMYHLNELGDSTWQAISVGEPLVEDSERVLGPDHPDTLRSRNRLANAYQDVGRAAEAITLHERTLAGRERVLGPGHPDTLASQGNLANAYGDAGRVAEAIPLHERALAGTERVLGPDHAQTLKMQGNLANAYGDAGRVAEAIPLHERTLASEERVLGPDHPETLRSRDNLAGAYRNAGRAAEAIPLHERTLASKERVLGPDHPDTLRSRHNLADAYRDAGRAAEAIPLHERTLASKERVLGPDHPDTLRSRNDLALTYEAAGRVAEAIPLLERALAGRERVLGPDHPETLQSRDILALAYRDAGRDE